MISRSLLPTFALSFALGVPAYASPSLDPSETSRQVSYHNTDIVPIFTQVRFTTLIELPAEEVILEATCGDKEFWAVNWTGNLAYIKPAKLTTKTNINLITQAGNVYSFFVSEVSATNYSADLKVFVTPADQSAFISLHEKPRFVPVADVDVFKKRAENAEAQLAEQKADAQKQIQKEHIEAVSSVTAEIRHDYRYKPKGIRAPFHISSIYHDDRFTYIEATPSEPPAVYEIKDGKDSLVEFEFNESQHRYTIAKVLDAGYLRVGKTSLAFRRDLAD